MGRYIVKRIGQGIVTMWLVTLGVFVLLRLTGDPLGFLLMPQRRSRPYDCRLRLEQAALATVPDI